MPNHDCVNCSPAYGVVQNGRATQGNNMAPQYKVLAGQYERLTHHLDPLSGKPFSSPAIIGNCGYTSITSAYGANAQCCQTEYKPMGCCAGPAGSHWGYCGPNMTPAQPPITAKPAMAKGTVPF
jgi:hypothetical protein